ncbi:unnamed protein product [Chondrus crispus]|uniref:Histone deacetylase interacting domain-containing protein n=1 Tax=Chondrus crispus TaxID=2769 RepID=R7Q5C5_CHOCR|nr:unnamed protein product [Chondrus crispus]CDF33229.1 unnamed protein product [Chondrus crispus]|eukprot:XP_005713032.1 unnamed protein product [Chondrus crispus]
MAQTEQDKPAQARNGNRQPLPALPAEPQDGLERRPLKVEDALAYLEKVKTQFKEQVDVYNQFLDIMKEFKAQSIDTTEVIRRVSNLFRGHMDLILGFNTFLPPGYKIKVTKDKATGVVNTGFDGPEGFSQLPTFLSGSIAAPSPIAGGRNGNAVSSPKRKDSKSKSSAKLQTSRSGQAVPGQAIDPMDKDASGGAPVAARGSAPAKTASVSRQNGANGLHADASALQQEATTQAHLLQAERSFSPGPEKAQEFDRAIEFVTTIKERFSDDPDTFNKFLNALSRFRDKQTSIREVFDVVACLFGPHKDLLLKFQEFLPAISRGSLDKPMRSRPPTTPLDRAYSGKTATGPSRRGPGGLSRNRRPRDMQFFEDLKASLGLGKSDVYIDFIKCLSLFTQKIVTKDELQSLTAGILQDYPHANALFLQYLEAICGSGDETTDEGNQASSSVSSEEAPTPLDAARHARYLKKTVSETGGEFGVEKLVSYSKLPPDFPAFPCAGRSVMERRTLNDAWVSGTSGSEDYSFKFMRKNQNEDNLFRCEDDRYELDMVIATNASTIQKLQTIVGSMSRLPQAEKKRHQLAEGALSPINFSAIQRIYGEKGAEVVEEVKLNPAQAAPFVVERLRSKNTEWIRARHEMNRAWREVGERNYHRSLDHRSVHFKHVDKKELSTKNLLADLLEPTTSLQARDAEMTKARGYPVPHGGGGANDRSLAFKAVKEAAQRVSRLEPPHLDLCFEECRIHRLAFDVVRDRIESETSSSSEAKRIVGEFQRLLSRFFRLDFTDDGCKRAERDFCRRRGEKHDGCNSAERESNMVEEEAMVMYGDDSLYLMFRMYHLLFERLMEGLKLARKQIADRTKRESMNKAGAARVGGRSHIPTLLTSPASLIMNFPSAQEKEHSFCVGPQHATADEIFEEWLEPLRQFLSTNKADVVNRYEEKCRVLLGAGSYCLLTLDKTVAKTSKQVGSALSGDAVAEYGTVWMFHALADRIKESTQNCAKLSWSCMEKQYAACAVAQIGKTRGSGANMMRFTSHYRDEQMNEFVIYAVGHTNDEVAGKSKTQTASVDLKELYKTCTDMLEENMAQAKESGDGEWRQRGDSTSLRKRSRVSDDSFVRFAGSEKQVRKRAKGMKLRRGGDVIWKATAKKRIKAVEGTCDYMENVNRKRKLWSNTADAKEVNEQCVWGRVVRRKRLAKEKEEKEIEEREKEEEKEKENASVAKASGAGIAESSGDKEAGEVAEKDKMSDS